MVCHCSFTLPSPAADAELRQGFCAAYYAHHYVARAPAFGYKMQVLYDSLIVLIGTLILTLTCITPVIPPGGTRSAVAVSR